MNYSEKLNPIKKGIVLNLIGKGSQMIPSIAEGLGLSIPTVNKYITELVESGEVLKLGKIKGQRGRQPYYYGINPDSRYYIGVDVKNFGLTIGIINLLGELVYEKEDRSLIIDNTPEVLEKICSIICNTIEASGIERSKLRCVVFNLSGRVDTMNGYSHSIFNFEGDEEPLSDILSERIGIKAIIDNDTRAMTYGELVVGEGRKYSNFLFVNVAWGIGLGIVIDGKLYYGKNGYSGEFGHINVYNNELMCHCGKKGCLETEASGRAIHRKLLERLAAGEVSSLGNALHRGETVNVADIITAANSDDTLCIELIENAGSELGRQLANLINIFNPEALIIGGAMSNAGECFLSPIRQAIRKYSLRLVSREVDVKFSQLRDKIGIIGACMTARQRDIER